MERRHANKHTAATLTYIHGPGHPPWQPNWIDHRRSRRNVHRRADHGDTAQTCNTCGCETDVQPVPHSPRCKGDA